MTNYLQSKVCEVKLAPPASAGVGYTFKGYASFFGNRDSHGDVMHPDAFDMVLKKIADGEMSMPLMFFGHDHDSVPVGKYTKVYKDEKGLVVEGELTPNHSQAEDVRAALNHGTIDGLSIGYIVDEVEYPESGDRLIKSIGQLLEVSIVSIPSNAKTRIDLAEVKSALSESDNPIKSIESLLRDAGLSREAAKLVISETKAAHQREAESKTEVESKQQLNEAMMLLKLKSLI